MSKTKKRTDRFRKIVKGKNPKLILGKQAILKDRKNKDEKVRSVLTFEHIFSNNMTMAIHTSIYIFIEQI